MNLKSYKKLYNNSNICKIYYYIKNCNFIIFIDDQFNNKELLDLKIELLKFNNRCFIINSKYIKTLFNYKSFKFLSNNIIIICFKDFNTFLLIEKFLNNKFFNYSFKKCYSITKQFKDIYDLKNNEFLLSFIIFKLILYIILILLYIIYYILNI